MKFFKTNWPRLENPVGYLYKICRNIIIDYYRKTKHEFSLEKLQDAGIEMETYQNHEEKMLVEQILKEVNGLPEEQKEVLLMQYVQDLDNKTISQVIGKSESAVKSLAHRGLETLRETFSKEE